MRGADFRSGDQERALGWRHLDEMKRWEGHHHFWERILGCFVEVWGECCGWQEQRRRGLVALGRSRWGRRDACWGGWSHAMWGLWVLYHLLSTYNSDILLWKLNSMDLSREAVLYQLCAGWPSCSLSSSPSSCTWLSLPPTRQPSALVICPFCGQRAPHILASLLFFFFFDAQGSAEIDRLW